MHVLRAKATMVVMSEVWMVRWVGCFRWCLPMCEWWKGVAGGLDIHRQGVCGLLLLPVVDEGVNRIDKSGAVELS